MVQATATSRSVRTSAQKAGLVLDLIRGKDVTGALATLKFSTKGVAKSIHTLLTGTFDFMLVLTCVIQQRPSICDHLRVTTLAASGPGSLLAALETDGPRIVVFEVGGVIDFSM